MDGLDGDWVCFINHCKQKTYPTRNPPSTSNWMSNWMDWMSFAPSNPSNSTSISDQAPSDASPASAHLHQAQVSKRLKIVLHRRPWDIGIQMCLNLRDTGGAESGQHLQHLLLKKAELTAHTA